MTARLFRDFALPCVCPIIVARPSKRHACARLLYAYAQSSPTGHLAAIRTLQQALNNLPVFTHTLAVLVFIEDAFNVSVGDVPVTVCCL